MNQFPHFLDCHGEFLRPFHPTRNAKSPASGFRRVERFAYGHRKGVSALQYRRAWESRQVEIRGSRLMIWTTFNLNPIAMPSDGIRRSVANGEQREAQIVVGKIRVPNKRKRNRTGNR